MLIWFVSVIKIILWDFKSSLYHIYFIGDYKWIVLYFQSHYIYFFKIFSDLNNCLLRIDDFKLSIYLAWTTADSTYEHPIHDFFLRFIFKFRLVLKLSAESSNIDAVKVLCDSTRGKLMKSFLVIV